MGGAIHASPIVGLWEATGPPGLHTGMPAKDSCVVLTAVLADAIKLGLTRMADACSLASYRALAGHTFCNLTDAERRGVVLMPYLQGQKFTMVRKPSTSALPIRLPDAVGSATPPPGMKKY